jgi:membrane fusion protein, multidrug efflux system
LRNGKHGSGINTQVDRGIMARRFLHQTGRSWRFVEHQGCGVGALVTAAVVAILVSFICSCSGKNTGGGNGNAAPLALAPAAPVKVAQASIKTVPLEVRVIGNVEAYSTVTVRAQIDGQLERVYFTEGQNANAGDLLFTIDSRPYQARLQQAQANLARDEAQSANARSQAERYTQLFQAGIVSKDQFEQFHTNAAALDAAVRADKAAVEDARIQLGYCTIRSPIGGRTGNLMMHPGNTIKANDAALVVINQVQPIYVDFSVPEQYLPEVKSHFAHGKLPVRAVIPQEENSPVSGSLSFVNNAVDVNTGTILLKGTFSNADRRLWPGQFVNVILKLSEQANAIVIPYQAVQTGQNGNFVFVVKEDSTVEMRPVSTGSTFEGAIVIQKGLKLGETVVTDGQLRLFPGARIEVKNG